MTPSTKMLIIGFISALFTIGIVAGIWLLLHRNSGVDFFVDFQNAQGLKAGDTIILSGMEVGRVRNVRLLNDGSNIEVACHLDPEFTERVRSDSRATIHGGGGMMNPFAAKVLEIIPPADSNPAPLLRSGARLAGLNSELEKQTWQLGQALGAASAAIGHRVEEMGEALKNLETQLEGATRSPEVQQLQRDMEDFLRKLEQSGQNVTNQTQQEWSTLQKRIEDEKERLKSEGEDTVAEQLKQVEQQIDKTVKQAERSTERQTTP